MNQHIFRVMLTSLILWSGITLGLFASSHREAPLIANDPLADNTDLYAFRSPDDPNSVTLIAGYVPLQLPHGGPNYYQFGENVRYEIHVDNDVSTAGDDIVYRVTFSIENQDPTTFFNIRLGQQNLKTTYKLERSMDGGQTFSVILNKGIVPPPNVGTRSIEGIAGLNSDYETLFSQAIGTASTGEKVFCGTADDPFFVDLGGIFDLGDSPRQMGEPVDGVACKNVSIIAIQVPISTLQKDGKQVSHATDILDGDYVIGVWASASRQQIRTLKDDGTPTYRGDWVQVSRIGMPLTNEAVIPIGQKDEWNARTPYNEDPAHFAYFYNPELGLYMDDSLFGGAVPAFSPLRIQRNSLGAFDFGNGQDGLFGLKGSAAVAGTALDDAVFGTLLLPGAGKPRSVDLWPAFHTGVPNVRPYQLATGKNGDPLAAGKPFVNNFLPNGGDMLRLNMATPTTPRNDPAFSSLGLIQAAVLGLTDPAYTASTSIQAIPNMDGFPNGRRLEDDVTRIELQAVSGVVLAAIGLWYDDFTPGGSPLTQDLLDVLTYTTGIEHNDTSFRSTFPYVQLPWSGTGKCGGEPVSYTQPTVLDPTGSPAIAQNLQVSDETAFLVPLNWKDRATSETGYVIRRQTASHGLEIVDTVAANVTDYTDTVLVFGEQVEYSVVAFDGFGASQPSNVDTYEMPASFKPLSLSFVCLDEAANVLTWAVSNPNDQALPFIWAQFWSDQRDTLFALPGEVYFQTSANVQDPNTFGDDNITGIYYAVENGNEREDVVFSLGKETGCAFKGAIPFAPQSGYIAASVNIEQEEKALKQMLSKHALHLLPNPATDQLQVRLTDLDGQGSLRLLDMMGRVVRSKQIELTENQTMDVSGLARGLYLVEVKTPHMVLSRRLIKQ